MQSESLSKTLITVNIYWINILLHQKYIKWLYLRCEHTRQE